MEVKPIEVKNDVKPNNVNNYVQLEEANDDVKSDARSTVVEIDVRAQFTKKKVFFIRKHMLQWVRRETKKLRLAL